MNDELIFQHNWDEGNILCHPLMVGPPHWAVTNPLRGPALHVTPGLLTLSLTDSS